MRSKWHFQILVYLSFLFLVYAVPVRASAVGELGDLDFSSLEEYLEGSLSEENISFQEMVTAAISGDFKSLFSLFGSRLHRVFLSEIHGNVASLRKMLVLVIFSSLYLHLASSFVNGGGPGRIGFLTAYLMMAALVLSAFQSALGIASGVLEQILTFMGLLLPLFFVAVAYAGGTMTAITFYQMMLIVIAGMEWVFKHLFLPLTEVYLVLLLVNSLSEEDFLSRLAVFLRRFLEWGIKTMTGLVIGVNLIQTMTLPLVDSVKNQSIRKMMSAIPWIGRGTDILTNVVLGSGALIKNGVGSAGILVLVLICLLPLCKLAILAFCYQGAAAIVQPVADKRLLSCIASTGEGCRLLLSLVLYTLVLFIISLAILCSASNLNYTAG